MKFAQMKMQAKLSSMLLLITTALFIGFGVYQYLQIRTSLTVDLQNRARFVIARLKENLIIPLWDADLNQIEKILLTEMHDPLVTAIIVKDHRAAILKVKYRNAQGEITDQNNTKALNGLTQTGAITREKDQLGTVEVTVTFKFMQSQLRHEMIRIFVGMLVLNSLLFFVLMFMTRTMIVAPLKQLVNMAHAVAEGNFQTKITVTTADEIGEVACSFQRMEGKIDDVLQEIARVIVAVQQGDLSIRGNTADLSGGWSELMSGMNDLIHAFVKPITMMAQRIQEISHGELPEEIPDNYYGDFHTISDHLNVMLRTLRSFATNIRTVAQQMAAMSQELSVNMEQLSHGVSQQAAATEEISATTEEMTSSILHTAGNAEKTEKIAAKSANTAKEGALSVAEAIRAMQKIAQTLPIIEEIASRTNMLSLNASIEAAKAQEYGKGFAVVATEVRNLALQSQNAAKEIRDLTQTMLQLAETANERLNRLLPDSQHTAELVQEISLANQEQSHGADQINQAIQQMDTTTQLHATIASSAARMIQQLALQAEQLRQTSEFFTLHETVLEGEDDVQELVKQLQMASHGETRTKLLTTLAYRILREVEPEKFKKTDAPEKLETSEKSSPNTLLPRPHNRTRSNPPDPPRVPSDEPDQDDLDQGFERF